MMVVVTAESLVATKVGLLVVLKAVMTVESLVVLMAALKAV